MSAPQNAEFANLGGWWTLPVIESNADGILRMHVSIAVGSSDDLADELVTCQVVAGGQSLNATEQPDAGGLAYLHTIGTTAVGMFTFDNPGNPPVESLTVSIGENSLSWNFGGDLPMV